MPCAQAPHRTAGFAAAARAPAAGPWAVATLARALFPLPATKLAAADNPANTANTRLAIPGLMASRLGVTLM